MELVGELLTSPFCSDRRVASTRKVVREMIYDLPRIILGAVDEARLPAAQDGQPEYDHSRGIDDDAALVAHIPLRVHDGDLQPAVVRAEAGRPQDRPDL